MKPRNIPLLTVIIPVFNVVDYLDDCLRSIINQGLDTDQFEVVMINDGSTDGSDLLAEIWTKQYENFKLISLHNQGPSVARNTGLKLASGKYIHFCDSDDIVAPGAYKNLLSKIEEFNTDFITGSVFRFNKSNKPYPWSRLSDLYTDNIVKTSIDENPEYIRLGAVWNSIFRRDFLINSEITFPEGKLYEDVATIPKYVYLASSFSVSDKPMYYWRANPDGISLNTTMRKITDRIDAVNSVFNFLIKNSCSDKIMREFNHYMADYNLRRILFNIWQLPSDEQLTVLKLSRPLADRLNSSDISRLDDDLRPIIVDLRNDKLSKLKRILSNKVNENQKNIVYTGLDKTRVAIRTVLGKIKRLVLKPETILRTVIGKPVLYIVVRPILFLLPTLKDTVVISNYWGTRYNSGSGPAAISIKLAEINPNFKQVILADPKCVKTIKENTKNLLPHNSNYSVVVNKSLSYYYYIWRAKYLINDVNFQMGIKFFGRFFLVNKQRDQIEIETTHGIPLKAMGFESQYDLKHVNMPYFKQKNKRYTYLVSSSKIVAKIFAESHGVNPKILKTGLPQNDYLLKGFSDQYMEDLKNKYRLQDGKKIILFAPTWRHDRNMSFNYLLDLHKLYRKFGDTHRLIIKTHTWSFTNLNGFKFSDITSVGADSSKFVNLFGVTANKPTSLDYIYRKNLRDEIKIDDSDINELMLISDILITDYSSTMFNYAHLSGKKMIFFTPDINHYISDRGLYFDIDKIAPGPVTKNTEEVIEAITLAHNNNVWNKKFSKQITKFKRDFLEWEKGSASLKILKKVGIIK